MSGYTEWFYWTYSVSQKNPPAACGFLTFFDKRLRILNQFFTHLYIILHVSIYARLQIFIHLSKTLTMLCHIKCDYLVHLICALRKMSKTHQNARVQTFA